LSTIKGERSRHPSVQR